MFSVKKRLIGDVEPMIYAVPAASESFSLGEAVKMGASGLTKAAATDKPAYLVAGKVNAAGLLPVIPLLPTSIFEAECGVQIAKTLVGSKLTLAADALSVTATTTGGVFTLLSTDGTANSVVSGKFE